MQTTFALLMFISSVFLILLVLVQRGRGGGLSGAFGGMGGQSAFGAKAGDTFTRVTIIAATVWIVLCMLATGLLSGGDKEKSLLTESNDTTQGEVAGDQGASGDVPPAVDPSDLVPEAGTGGAAATDGDSTIPVDASAPADIGNTPAGDAAPSGDAAPVDTSAPVTAEVTEVVPGTEPVAPEPVAPATE